MKFLKKINSKSILIFLFVSLLFIDIFSLEQSYNFLILLGLFLLVLIIRKFKLSANVVLSMGLFFFAFIPLFLIVENKFFAEKAAIWSYLFFIVGMLNLVYEITFKKG